MPIHRRSFAYLTYFFDFLRLCRNRSAASIAFLFFGTAAVLSAQADTTRSNPTVDRLETALRQLAQDEDVPGVFSLTQKSLRTGEMRNLAAASVQLAKSALEIAAVSPEYAAKWGYAAAEVCSHPTISSDSPVSSVEIGKILHTLVNRLSDETPMLAARLRSSIGRTGNEVLQTAFATAESNAEVAAAAILEGERASGNLESADTDRASGI
jgi:hypothetical protein